MAEWRTRAEKRTAEQAGMWMDERVQGGGQADERTGASMLGERADGGG